MLKEYSVSLICICGESTLVIILLLKRKAILEFFEEFVNIFQTIVRTGDNVFTQYFHHINRLNGIIKATFIFESLKTVCTQSIFLANKRTELDIDWSTIYY